MSSSLGHAIKRFNGIIPMKKLMVDCAKTTGVAQANKKDTKVCVSFHLQSADWLPDETRQKLAEIHKMNIGKDGIFCIRSDKTSSQMLNIADCMDKLRCYISEAEQPPPESLLNQQTIELRRDTIERAAIERLKETKRQ